MMGIPRGFNNNITTFRCVQRTQDGFRNQQQMTQTAQSMIFLNRSRDMVDQVGLAIHSDRRSKSVSFEIEWIKSSDKTEIQPLTS